MDKKKLFLIIGIAVGVLVVAVAAFIAGRLLNGGGPLLGLLPLGKSGDMVTMSIQMNPAPELPTTMPTTSGIFVERNDNSIILQEFSMDSGAQGGVVVSSGAVPSSGTTSSGSDGGPVVQVVGGGSAGPQVEVVVTSDTILYKDVTEMNMNPQGGEQTVQQKVAEGSLDDLSSQTMIQVWGRKVGDRVIADMIFYSNPVMITAP